MGRAGLGHRGLGFELRVNPDYSLRPGAVGSFGWAGIWGTYFWIDPAARLAAVMMIQVNPEAIGPDRDGLRHLTYAALAVPSPALPKVAAATPSPAIAGTYDFGQSLSARDRRGPYAAYAGLGVTLEMQDGQVVARHASPMSAGFQGGVREGDILVEIDGTPLKGIWFSQVLEKLRGDAETPIRLRLIHKGQDTPGRNSPDSQADPPAGRSAGGADREWRTGGRGGRAVVGARFRQGQAGRARSRVEQRISVPGRRAHAALLCGRQGRSEPGSVAD
jgi:hypothetical protein